VRKAEPPTAWRLPFESEYEEDGFAINGSGCRKLQKRIDLFEKAAMVLYPYNEEWPHWFEELRQVITSALRERNVPIHHVGSTSIPGLAAKPIIDMDLVIPDYTALTQISEDLSRIGYYNNGEQGIKDRIAFKPADEEVPYCLPRRKWYAHHLYVCPAFSEELCWHLLFRDYLRKNAHDREEYEKIKKEIELESRGDRKVYAAIKEEKARTFVEEIIRKSRT
jgi:GrpB-like predicted nucleotidyltransferase (UPF0157 family)